MSLIKSILTLGLLLSYTFSFAQVEKEVEAKVNDLRLALIDPTVANLEAISSVDLSYGHSSGKVENQAQFIEALVSGVSDFVSVSFEDQTIQVKKNVALVRHNLVADVLDGGKANSIKIGVLLVWQKEKGSWKLLARQAYKLP
ncbi:nuclear transport factor 2 family protein [Algoriphagus jejuensis]|uniref:Nuclear transport factor 2 family protein n=1 Tax=Algoriphagus jejuensis TaxID=419934 RepID=A0ABN1N1K7_9BACT